jgi:hypothetical protein
MEEGDLAINHWIIRWKIKIGTLLSDFYFAFFVGRRMFL